MTLQAAPTNFPTDPNVCGTPAKPAVHYYSVSKGGNSLTSENWLCATTRSTHKSATTSPPSDALTKDQS